MENYKKDILEKICFTELVYSRINKKLKIELSKEKVEEMVITILKETEETNFQKIGKNIYVTNIEKNVKLTINSYTNRIITADKLDKKTNAQQRFAKIGVLVLTLHFVLYFCDQ